VDDQFVVTCPFCGEHIENTWNLTSPVTSFKTAKCAAIHGVFAFRATGEIVMLTWRGVMGPSRFLGPPLSVP
jgi:hypothetical protein